MVSGVKRTVRTNEDCEALPFSILLLLCLRVFSSRLIEALEQSDSEQLLQFFTKSRWLDMKFQIQPCALNQ